MNGTPKTHVSGVWFHPDTPEKVRKMYNLYRNGFSLRRIAPLYDMTFRGVAYHFKRWQLPLRVQGYPTEADKWQGME